MNGTLEAYYEQGMEGRIEFAFAADGATKPIFLKNGDVLTIYASNGGILWSGKIKFVARRMWDNHTLKADIWSYVKQEGVSYAQWMDWFWRKPPLRAKLEAS